ncbi:hypothetical protein CBR_g45350 [Chara braunii]|uniref:Uncharacterized protein n=1 Tax=Chara braunii TaxID=69332 RepID=A0A388LYF4_CHABU|nr:hypothetical protein CBR_g45350 [Chara braunii]|eukprot:GBG87291.1 hypothetical protein CBR_g45350 [Chara braunii]
MGNPSEKQDQVRDCHKFCTTALHKAPQKSLWLLADQKEEEVIKKQNVALRSYLPLAMAGENVWKLAVEFFEKWDTGRLLSHDGAKWIVKKKKVKNVKPGVAYIHNDKLGGTEVVYNVPVDPSNKKGKKEKEEGDWFVQVPDPDAHCWKTMESLTDNEKCRVLKKVLACEVVWVQAGSPSLAKLGKLSVQDVVQLVKCDRVLVRLWNYYQFKHEKRPDADGIQRYPFLRSRSVVFKKYEGQGLNDELWDNSRKHVSDSALFKDCPPYMGCDQDNSIEVTEKLAGHKNLSVVKSKVNSGGHNCEFMVVRPTWDKVWSDKTDMWFKLSERKRNKIYDFLFLQTHPRRDADTEYICRKDHMLALLNNYHFTFRLNVKTFIERLQSLYFLESEEQFKLASYTSLISTDDEEAICVEFVANAKEEESDTESIDLQYDPPLADHGRASSSAGPSPSAVALVSPLAKPAPGTTPMKLLERLRALACFACSGGVSPGSGGDGGGDAGGGKGIPPMGERGSHARNTTPGGSAGVAGFVVDRTPSTGTRPEHTTHSADPPTSSVGSARDTLAALVALGSRSAGKPKSAGIRTTSGEEPPERSGMRSCSGSGDPSKDREIRSIAVRDGDVGKVSPERERRPQGLQREAASAGSGDTETTKSAEIRTSSGGVCRPGIVVPLRGAACTGTEGWSSRFSMGTAEGDEFRGREVGEKMEEQKGAQEGEEEGEEEVEGEEAGETELIDLFEGREGVGYGEDKVEHSEDDAGSGESSDEFGQLYGEHHEDDVDDDATTIEMETQVVSSLSAEPEDSAVRPLTSVVDLQHPFDEASVAISPFEKSRRISIHEVIDGILGDHNVSARPYATANVASSVAAALASSPPKSLVLSATLAAEGEGVVSSRTRRSSKYPEHILQKVPGLSKKHKDMLKASEVDVEIGKKEYTVAIEECLSLLAPEKGTYPRSQKISSPSCMSTAG